MNCSLGVRIPPSGLFCLVVRRMCGICVGLARCCGYRPPWAKWGAAVQNILVHQAKGIAVIPVDKTKSWFWALGEVAVDWWDLPNQVPIFSDAEGWRYPQQKGVTTRVVLFDAFGNDQGDDKPTEAWDDVQPGSADRLSSSDAPIQSH